MNSVNPITTFSVTNLQSIAAATKVTIFPRPISSTTSVPGISASPIHLLTMNQMAQTWCDKKLSSQQAWNWILAACNTVIWWWANRICIQQPDCFIKTLLFKIVVDCIENRIKYWAWIFSIEHLLTILHLIINPPCTFVLVVFVLNDFFKLLGCKLRR